MKNAETYLRLFAALENAVKKKYRCTVEAAESGPLKHYHDQLKNIRSLRNVLTHSKPFGLEHCAEPHEKMLQVLKNILDEVDDSRISHHMVPFSKIKWATLDDSVLEYMNILRNNVYTHIPILDENHRVIGVFGESTLFSMVLNKANDNDMELIEKETVFRDYIDAIKLENQATEEFVFLSRSATILDCRYEFHQCFSRPKRRLGMIFITENGSPNEALLGLITAWGILGMEPVNKMKSGSKSN